MSSACARPATRSEAPTFTWDIYAFGAGSDLDATNINLSGLDATNDFSSPDGLWFARPSNAAGQVTPLLWIETDDGAYTDVTNCMLLAAIPGTVGDGGTRTITNTLGGADRDRRPPGSARRRAPTLKRFLVGPKECEITGIDSTPDGRSLFVNIQHPGESGGPPNITSNWPRARRAGTGTGAAALGDDRHHQDRRRHRRPVIHRVPRRGPARHPLGRKRICRLRTFKISRA